MAAYEAVDRNSYKQGRPNDDILKSKSAVKFLDPWDIAIFQGGENGVLHRTPDAALESPSVLMRLDSPDFWEKTLN